MVSQCQTQKSYGPYTYLHRQMDGLTDGRTEGQKDRRTDQQTDGKIERQTDVQMDRQTDRVIPTYPPEIRSQRV